MGEAHDFAHLGTGCVDRQVRGTERRKKRKEAHLEGVFSLLLALEELAGLVGETMNQRAAEIAKTQGALPVLGELLPSEQCFPELGGFMPLFQGEDWARVLRAATVFVDRKERGREREERSERDRESKREEGGRKEKKSPLLLSGKRARYPGRRRAPSRRPWCRTMRIFDPTPPAESSPRSTATRHTVRACQKGEGVTQKDTRDKGSRNETGQNHTWGHKERAR